MEVSDLRLILVVLILASFNGCNSQEGELPDLPYDLDAPVKNCVLPPALNEISGLELLDSSRLLCHNDEEGILFIYNVMADTIDKQLKFGKGRDYEGVTQKGSDAYVVASDGDLVKVQDFESPERRKATKYENDLDDDNNVEGLCYLKEMDALLLACKDDPGHDKEDQKALYTYDLSSHQLKPYDPFITIDLEKIEEAILNNTLDQLSNRLREAFAFDEDQADLFRPSGVALHPKTGDLYVLSAKYSMLVILDQQYRFEQVVPFRQSYFQQPEGITFSNDGDLFISNEANDGVPNILWFEYQAN